jgi:hypothetical protein
MIAASQEFKRSGAPKSKRTGYFFLFFSPIFKKYLCLDPRNFICILDPILGAIGCGAEVTQLGVIPMAPSCDVTLTAPCS